MNAIPTEARAMRPVPTSRNDIRRPAPASPIGVVDGSPDITRFQFRASSNWSSNLGIMYTNGTGVQQDYAKAAEWYRRAAEQGHANAALNLGVMYASGRGVPRDRVEAARWFREAAERGDVHAQANLGYMHDNGIGVPQDHAEAMRWYRMAADQGYATAQNMLAVMCIDGCSVPQDAALAPAATFRREVQSCPAVDRNVVGNVADRLDEPVTIDYHRDIEGTGPKALRWLHAGRNLFTAISEIWLFSSEGRRDWQHSRPHS
jgi:TPR repeat protein